MLLNIQFLDDATRPRAPKFEGLTPVQREPGLHLARVHTQFRDNMKSLRELIERATAGEVSTEELQQRADSMPLIDNYRRFGNLCGQHCQSVNTHHSIEDQSVFPVLHEKSAALRKVVDRLEAEHVVVHELLVRLIAAINVLIGETSRENFAACRETYEALEQVLLSHFGYEEEEIGDALGYYGFNG